MLWQLEGERDGAFAMPRDASTLKHLAKKAFALFGIRLSRIDTDVDRLNLVEASPVDLKIMEDVRPYTMTSPARLWALVNAVQYISANGIEGDVCECGVWRGGSMMAAALKLKSAGDFRNVSLYDTFAGMSEPTEYDRAIDGTISTSPVPAFEEWRKYQRGDGANQWCFASLDDVRRNMESTGYPMERVRFVAGKVEETLSVRSNLPSAIALLRLDTDFYESTRAELEALYERVSPGGVLILDDYGYWEGQRRAVDEFFASRRHKILLDRIDSIGRIGVKIA